MAEAFKDIFNTRFFDRFTGDLRRVINDVDAHAFVRQVMDNEWENYGYKQRIKRITAVLHHFLPSDYKKAAAIILDLIDTVKDRFPDFSRIDDKNFQLLSLEYGAILDNYIAEYGLDDYATSINAIEKITQFTTCEFCVRPFIIRYPNEMMKQMLVWSKHNHWGVRRLASEGCRPRLPWGMALPNLKENPAPILSILENLKNDPSRFVRLSVANNLNDMVKDNPETVIRLAKKWHGTSKEVDWIIKHGCRTLLKQGNTTIMELFGLQTDVQQISVDNFNITATNVKPGNSLEFSFDLSNKNDKNHKIRLEYGIYYQKANGKLARKVHKISEKEYAGNSKSTIIRKHAFREVTTRKLYPGLHQVAVIINGNEFEKHPFELIT